MKKRLTTKSREASCDLFKRHPVESIKLRLSNVVHQTHCINYNIQFIQFILHRTQQTYRRNTQT